MTESGCPYLGALNLQFLIQLELHLFGKRLEYVHKITIGSWHPYFIIAMHLVFLLHYKSLVLENILDPLDVSLAK